nr:hypothetical protein [Tanacetum cinerariifolium]
MRTRSSSNLPVESPPNPSTSNPIRRNHRRSKQPFILEESPADTMADQRTMTELLRTPTEGYAEAIVVPPILAEQFELKYSLINMMTSDQFFGLEKDNPHDHIRWLNKITSTIKYKDVPNSTIKLMLFPLSLPEFDKSFHEAWDRYNDLLCVWPYHGFTELHQLDTFYNALNPTDQDSLSSAAGGNLWKDVLMMSSVKAIEEICVTCGGAHPYYQCLAAGGNIFPELRDNIQGYVAAAVVNYNQGNSGYRPSIVPLSELEKVKKMNEANMKAMKIQINNVKNKLRNEMKNSIQASMSNQTNELKNMMASFFQMNTASTSGLGSLPSNTIANLKGELKAITTRSGVVLDGPSIPIPHPFINMEEDKRVDETLTDQDLAEYTIKVPPPLVQKSKPPSQRNFVVHQRDPFHPNIPYPSRMHKQKQQEKDEEKLLELANTPLFYNCSTVILKKLPERLGDPGKFFILCGFSELKCKALTDLGASINLMPLSVWKKLGLPELICTRMTLELANRAIYTSTGIARDVFVLVGKFTFLADFVIVDYESDPRVPLILGRTFLWTARALIDVHREEMILRDESINMINICDNLSEDFLENLFSTNHQSGNPTFSSHPESPPPHYINTLSVSTTSFSSPTHLLAEFADELALITFPPRNDDLPFDIEFDIKEIEYLLQHDPIKDIESILKDSVDKSNLADLNDNIVDCMPEMFTDEHALDYSSPPLYDEYDDDLLKVKSDTKYVYDDPFNFKGEKIKESKLFIDELDLPSDFLLTFEYDSFLSEYFSEVDSLPSTNTEDKVFNPCILIQENIFKVITRVASEKNEKKLAISHTSLIFEDFDPPLNELPFFKGVPDAETLLLFSSENEEKVFKPGIHTSKVHFSLIPELSHQGYKVFKIIQILKISMDIFLFSCGENIRILDVPCLHFYPP